jgi:hypothetical protein
LLNNGEDPQGIAGDVRPAVEGLIASTTGGSAVPIPKDRIGVLLALRLGIVGSEEKKRTVTEFEELSLPDEALIFVRKGSQLAPVLP